MESAYQHTCVMGEGVKERKRKRDGERDDKRRREKYTNRDNVKNTNRDIYNIKEGQNMEDRERKSKTEQGNGYFHPGFVIDWPSLYIHLCI